MLFAVGSGFYIGAGLGPGPRDSVMTSLAAPGPVGWAWSAPASRSRCCAWAGCSAARSASAPLLFALAIGPLVAFFLPRLSLDPVAPTTLEAY